MRVKYPSFRANMGFDLQYVLICIYISVGLKWGTWGMQWRCSSFSIVGQYNLGVEKLKDIYACWGPFVESPMERKAQWWGPQEIDYE